MSVSGWRPVALREVATFASGKTPSRSRQAEFFDGGTVPWVKTLDLTNSGIESTDECVTTRAIREVKLGVHPVGTVLVAMYGGFNQIGRTGVLRIPAATNQAITAVVPDQAKLNPDFLLHTLNYRVSHWRTVASSSRKDPNITKVDVRAFPLELPPIAEQEIVAAALNDINGLMRRLNRLIAKKKAIKQGMAQQLLTGKARLPGFEQEWRHATVSSLARVAGGGTPSTRVSAYWGGGIPWLTPAEIDAEGSGVVSISERTITPDGLANCAAALLPAGTVLVTSRASVGNCAVAEVPVTTNQGFASMIPKDGRSTWFLYYWTQQNRSELESRAAGSTFLEISAGKVAAIPIRQPSLDEQRAIGAVLRDVDLELDVLRRRVGKAAAIKQGMAQRLLTGKTRLAALEAVA